MAKDLFSSLDLNLYEHFLLFIKKKHQKAAERLFVSQ